MSYSQPNQAPVVGISIGVLLVALLIAAAFVGCPSYSVYLRKMEGEGELSQAESNRKIAVLEAQAKLEAAKSLAAAEIERAKGVAEANRIIGEGLKGNEDYLRYLWLTELKSPSQTVIYVPTEANMPILEAGKRP